MLEILRKILISKWKSQKKKNLKIKIFIFYSKMKKCALCNFLKTLSLLKLKGDQNHFFFFFCCSNHYNSIKNYWKILNLGTISSSTYWLQVLAYKSYSVALLVLAQLQNNIAITTTHITYTIRINKAYL